MRKRIPFFAGSACALSLLGPLSAFAQCALCRDAAAASPPATREAMNVAIVGLAFAPYLVGTLAAWILFPALRARVRARFLHRTLRGASRPS